MEEGQYSLRERISLAYDWHVRYRLYRWRQNAAIWISWNLVPRWIAKWVIVKYFAKATGDDRHPDEVTFSDVYKAVDP